MVINKDNTVIHTHKLIEKNRLICALVNKKQDETLLEKAFFFSLNTHAHAHTEGMLFWISA